MKQQDQLHPDKQHKAFTEALWHLVSAVSSTHDTVLATIGMCQYIKHFLKKLKDQVA